MSMWRATAAAVLLTGFCTIAQAGVVIGGTRLIYDGAKKEASININNPDNKPYLIQSWVDSGETNGRAQVIKAPFIVTPPLFRLNASQQNILRVVRAGGNLPTDKESLFWLNIKSIPSAEKLQNTLQIAVKTRIKLIFRPADLKSKLEDAAKTLIWKKTGNRLQVTNPSPHFISFFNVKINGSTVKAATLVAPHSSATFELPANMSSGALTWQYINDYGGSSTVLSSSI